jgi:glucosamine--fructose-6-phosphate aminotransferase (isomerizing)
MMAAVPAIAREAGEAADAARDQIARCAGRFAELGARLRRQPPRLVATCARGSSDHAATFAKYLLETHAGILTTSVAPSVMSLYRAKTTLKDALFLIISQSGASPDLVAAAHEAKQSGAFVLALVNTENSPLAAAADEVAPLCAGAERSVAATKSFIASLSAIVGLAAHWTNDPDLKRALASAPDLLRKAWGLDWSAAAPTLARAQSMYVIGRGLGFGVAGEAALKLKETSRIHAEAYSAAEVRHGPLALIQKGFPALLFAQSDETRAGVVELASDLSRMGASVFLAGAEADGATTLPWLDAHPAIQPMLLAQSFYRLTHDIALARGCDPDRPPHLAKVTETL